MQVPSLRLAVDSSDNTASTSASPLASMLSALTSVSSPSPAVSLMGPSTPWQVPVKDDSVNNALRARYVNYRAQGGKIVDARRKKLPPKNNRGEQMCIAYHAKGDCVIGCGCKSNHAPHVPQEDSRLCSWMLETMVGQPPNTASAWQLGKPASLLDLVQPPTHAAPPWPTLPAAATWQCLHSLPVQPLHVSASPLTPPSVLPSAKATSTCLPLVSLLLTLLLPSNAWARLHSLPNKVAWVIYTQTLAPCHIWPPVY